jgi:hypothetical protein
VAADARQRLAGLLGEMDVPGSFSAREVAPPDDLNIEVRGVGPLRFPVPDEQARALCEIGRPAHYGRGELTLLDRRVRDTWEIPSSRVRIDKRRWNRTLVPILDALRDDLGLPSGCRLEAELHAMLVYARGQFFLPHKDSEKHDDMIGTLVVTLPGPFTGGSLIVEHEGQRATYRGSKAVLSFVAFYADCRHEVKPVTSGHRIVLTYNLLLRRNDTEPAPSDVPPEVAAELALLLQEHFAAPPPPRWRGDRAAGEPPSRLVYLLDHEYTERGLDWGRLKGRDAGRAALLRDTARRVGCDAVLALAKVHETWSTIESDYEDRWYGRRRSGAWSEWDDDPEGADLDDHEVDELIEQSVELECSMEPSAAPPVRPVALSVPDYEVCATTPSDQLKPYASEYEGNMGNYGNTLDRWYRRGAVFLWPSAKAFAVRAETDPAWALASISTRLRAGEIADARQMAASLTPLWATATPAGQTSRFVATALRVAGGLDEPALASMLLAPFATEALGRAHAAPLAALVERYGEGFLASLLATWSGRRQQWSAPGTTRAEWVASLPALCEALHARGASGTAAALVFAQDSARCLRAAVTQALAVRAPSRRNQALGELAEPLAAVLHSVALLGATELRDELIGFCQAGGDELVTGLVQALRAAAALAPELRGAAGVDVLAGHCADRLAARLALPQREQGDWAIEPPADCACELCGVLSGFLCDPAAQVFEWPLAEQRRRHVHAMIDAAELPVRHQTRRRGRPYTLVLTKTEVLFEAERQERDREQADAAWLAAAWTPAPAAPLAGGDDSSDGQRSGWPRGVRRLARN